MMEEFTDRIQHAKDKQFMMLDRFHIGDTVYPFWLHNFIVYGTVIDIDTVARKINCDFNGVLRQFCPEDLMLVNPVLVASGKTKKASVEETHLSPDTDNGISAVCKECGGEIAVSYDEQNATSDFVCTQCGKRIPESMLSKKSKKAMRNKLAKINKEEYAYYVILSDGEIESGWEYKEDAQDRVNELKEDGIPAKVGAKRSLKNKVDDDSNWHKGVLKKASREKLYDTVGVESTLDDDKNTHYVVLNFNNRIVSGHKSLEEATKKMEKYNKDGVYCHVESRSELKQRAEDDTHWNRGQIASNKKIAKQLAMLAKSLVADEKIV